MAQLKCIGFYHGPLTNRQLFWEVTFYQECGKTPIARRVGPLPNQPLQPTQLHSGENSSRGWGHSTSVQGEPI